MQNKEIEEDNTFKISIPLITNAELNAIDNNLDDIVNLFTKQVIHDKDLLVAQHIIKRQKEYIEQLENKVKKSETDKQKLIEKLEEQANRKIPLAEDGDYIQGYRDLARDLLEIAKGEKE